MPNTLRDLLKAAKEEEMDPQFAIPISDEGDFEEMDDSRPLFSVGGFSAVMSVEESSKKAEDSLALLAIVTSGDGSEVTEDDSALSSTLTDVDGLEEADASYPLAHTFIDRDNLKETDDSDSDPLSPTVNRKNDLDVAENDPPLSPPITDGGGSEDAVDDSFSPALTGEENSKETQDPPALHPVLAVDNDSKEADDSIANAGESMKEADYSHPLSPLSVKDDLNESENSDPPPALPITHGDGAKDAADDSLSSALTAGEYSKEVLDTSSFRDSLIRAGKGHLLPPPLLNLEDYDWDDPEYSYPIPPPLTVEDDPNEPDASLVASCAASDRAEQNAPLEKEAEPEEALPVKSFNRLKEPAEKDSFPGEASLVETGSDDPLEEKSDARSFLVDCESTETSVSLARSGTPEKISELPEDGKRISQDNLPSSIIKYQDSEDVDQGSKSVKEISVSPVSETAESTESEGFLDYELKGSQASIDKEKDSELKEKCQDSNDIGDEYKPEGEEDSTVHNKMGGIQSNGNIPDNPSFAMKTSLRPCPSVGNSLEKLDLNSTSLAFRSSGSNPSPHNFPMVEEAWEKLRMSYVYYKGKPVGTLAAIDPNAEALNYNQVFVRDFVPTGLACLVKKNPEPEIVKNFLLKTLHLQGWEKRVDNFTLGEGVMPASFKVLHLEKETLIADFGGSAIGRVAPVDSGFWWIILLRSYTKCTHDYTLSELPEVQRGMKLILNLCLSDGFDTFPTLLCADGCSMIDRRMGIYGYPIEIQALFYFALRCAGQMLKPERDGKELIERIEKRITALSYHIRTYFWLDFEQLNIVYRYKTEEYSHTAVNKFNVIPDSIPDWVFDFMPLKGGYFIGNVSPARMDFRWFLVGNCIAILSSLATPAQATAIMDLIEERWQDLIGEMPLKIVYPALEGHEWRTVTGFDPKNTRWSYHNGGSWPVLLWLLTAACIKTGRPQIAKRAIEQIEQRLSKDGWPEYYDGKTGRYVGKQARKSQTWSISGYLVAKMMIENPCNLLLISLEEDKKINKPLRRSNSF